jgi:gluconokinase
MHSTTSISNPESTTNLIIVMGVSGSGKSTVAAATAKHYEYCFLDADDFHSEENKRHMASGQPLTDAMRIPWVNSLKEYLQSANAKQQHCVLAFSGLRKQHRNELRKAGLKTIFIFLNGSKEIIQQRVNLRQNHFMNPDLVDSQFAAMEDPTQEMDVHSIEVYESLESVMTEVVRTLDQHLLNP